MNKEYNIIRKAGLVSIHQDSHLIQIKGEISSNLIHKIPIKMLKPMKTEKHESSMHINQEETKKQESCSIFKQLGE